MTVNVKDNFIINPDKFYSPSYRIGPFSTLNIAKDISLKISSDYRSSFCEKIANKDFIFTKTGKHAINEALTAIKLSKSDTVTILTPTQNLYVSGCVTREIEKFCKWSREIEKNTKAIFIIHEFGKLYKNISNLHKYNIPIIEDACHSYFSQTSENNMGTESDFVLFSLPKAYPMQFGGMLYFNKEKWNIRETLNKEEKNYIGSRVSNYAIKEIDFIKTKKNNYRKLVKIFKSLGCAPYFYYEENETPGVFMFTPPANVNLDALKEHGWKHGIECSIFYGKHAFFIPTHQFLTSIDLEYFKVVFSNFLGKSE